MILVDTHSHLFSEEFDNDLSDVVSRAKEVGVKRVLLPNIDCSSMERLKRTVSSDTGFFMGMMGLHPTSVGENWENELQIIYQELKNGDYIAVGEIGIDLYWDKTYEKEQIKVFEEQLRWSLEFDVPVSIHARNAHNEVVRSIKNVGSELRGVFHSFGGNRHEMEELLKFDGFYIGVNGVVTFKNSGLSETLKHCPSERLVIETDSPYLSPVPNRGKRNESSNLVHIVKKISDIWQMDVEEVASLTSENASKLFCLEL